MSTADSTRAADFSEDASTAGAATSAGEATPPAGAAHRPGAICDTGPPLHLHEIGQLPALVVFGDLSLPDLVADELRARGVVLERAGLPGLTITVVGVPPEQWRPLLAPPDADPNPASPPAGRAGRPRAGAVDPVEHAIQPADAQVLAVARADRGGRVVLTDDLALRRRLEAQGSTAVGTIGVLVRAYRTGRLPRGDLERAIEALFDRSTLHLSRAFRAYVRRLLAGLP